MTGNDLFRLNFLLNECLVKLSTTQKGQTINYVNNKHVTCSQQNLKKGFIKTSCHDSSQITASLSV